MLKEFELLWNKELDKDVEQLLALNSAGIDYIPGTDDGKGNVSYKAK